MCVSVTAKLDHEIWVSCPVEIIGTESKCSYHVHSDAEPYMSIRRHILQQPFLRHVQSTIFHKHSPIDGGLGVCNYDALKRIHTLERL